MRRLGWLALALLGCDDNEADFEVQVTNNSPEYPFSDSDGFAVPDGDTEPGPALPGHSYSFSFAAGPGSTLHFATMQVQSNDQFFAPDAGGIELFSEDGTPLSGDITDLVLLWDAGTEVNQEPGLGPDQAPRQAGPNQGDIDLDSTVRLAEDEFGNLPEIEDVIRVTLSVEDDHLFTVVIENISAMDAIPTSDGGAVPVVLAPGVFAISPVDAQLFASGQAAPEGLEELAEDGDISVALASLDGVTGLTTPISPVAWGLNQGSPVIFTEGQEASAELELLAEDGDASGIGVALGLEGGFYTVPDGQTAGGPASPGDSYTFQIRAFEGDNLSIVTMLVQSNDWFFGADGDTLPLFDDDGEARGFVANLAVYDAGTEVDEVLGAGPNQAPRQAGPNTGPDENGVVEEQSGYSNYVQVRVRPLE